MQFDRTAPGGGVEVACRLENGKAFLRWEFYFQKEEDSRIRNENVQGMLLIRLIDAQENTALECVQELGEEEQMQSVMLHPQLWDSIRDPHLYTMEAYITDREGRCFDRICTRLPLRSLEMQGANGLFLNGKHFSIRAVAYSVPAFGSGAESQRLVFEDLQQLRKLGANCIYMEKKEGLAKPFLQLCDRMGFFVLSESTDNSKSLRIYGWKNRLEVECLEEIPLFRGVSDSLFLPGSRRPTSLFYKYKAKWGGEPFVYIVPESVKRLESGNYTALCYSSCSKIALYSDGILFEFKKGEAEFEFQEIPAKSPCIMLAAEGDGCSAALSIHKTFVNRLKNGI